MARAPIPSRRQQSLPAGRRRRAASARPGLGRQRPGWPSGAGTVKKLQVEAISGPGRTGGPRSQRQNLIRVTGTPKLDPSHWHSSSRLSCLARARRAGDVHGHTPPGWLVAGTLTTDQAAESAWAPVHPSQPPTTEPDRRLTRRLGSAHVCHAHGRREWVQI